jgi:hypothetical protein
MTGGILGVTGGDFTPARKADSGDKMIYQAASIGCQNVHLVVAVAAAKRAIFLPGSIH